MIEKIKRLNELSQNSQDFNKSHSARYMISVMAEMIAISQEITAAILTDFKKRIESLEDKNV